MKGHVLALALAGSAFILASADSADSLDVVVSVKPVHSLVAAVMHEVGAPKLLVKGAGSAHTYSMLPSDARALSQADLVFWVGEGLETFLAGPLASLGRKSRIVELSEAGGLTLRPYREGGPWEMDLDDRAGEQARDGVHEHSPGESDEHDGAHAGHDMHLWLDPMNAKAMVPAIVDALSRADPANADRYARNGEALEGRLASLHETLQEELAPLRDRPFIVFHDAYQYLEKRYGLAAAGSVTVSPERQPGAERLRRIRDKIRSTGAICIFAEPQFEPKLVETLAEGLPVRTGSLDPHGAMYEPGPHLYFELLRGLARSLRECLLERS